MQTLSFVLYDWSYNTCTHDSKTCLKQPLKKKTKIGFQDRLSLNAGQSIEECPKGNNLQYF